MAQPAGVSMSLTIRPHDRFVAASVPRVIVELANGPVTGEADAILRFKDILVVPDILANAGGVTVSYFEWIQNRTGDYWTVDRVQSRLREIMNEQFRQVWDLHEQKQIDMRTAGYVVALNRLGEAIRSRGTMKYFTGEE